MKIQVLDSLSLLALPDIYGTEKNDTLSGTDGEDTIYGLGGKDTVHGLGGNDLIYGGAGDDRLYGDEGDDVIWGDAGNNKIYGGDGRDSLFGGDGKDEIHGGEGTDFIWGFEGANKLYGDGGNDEIIGGFENDILYGGTGDDIIEANGGKDRLYGEDGDDVLQGEDGKDILDGGDGTDRLYGGADSDSLDGGAGIDYAFYSGNFSDFRIRTNSTGVTEVKDLRVDGDGTDKLENVERLMFWDKTVALSAPDHDSTFAGATAIDATDITGGHFSAAASLDLPDDVDIWRVYLQAGQSVTASAESGPSNDPRMDIAAYGPGGEFIGVNHDDQQDDPDGPIPPTRSASWPGMRAITTSRYPAMPMCRPGRTTPWGRTTMAIRGRAGIMSST